MLKDYTKEFEDILKDILENETVLKMQNFNQHYSTSCYEHSKNVAYYSYLMAKKWNLDYVSATRAGMLHDLFLYDWRIPSKEHKKLHAFRHPRIAYNNAKEIFNLNEKEKDSILKHMWPLTIVPPICKEAYVVTLADKYCTYLENRKYIKENRKFQKMYRYAYVFLSMVVIRFV